MLRNVACGWQIQRTADRPKLGGAADVPKNQFPRASLDRDGELEIRYVKFPRYDLLGLDLADFRPDPY